MARIEVHGADIGEEGITRLRVRMHNLPPRTISRAEAVAWMRDGHSMVPIRKANAGPALRLVEREDGFALREDGLATPEDHLSGLPSVEDAL